MLLLPPSFRVYPLATQQRNMCPITGGGGCGGVWGGARCEGRIKV